MKTKQEILDQHRKEAKVTCHPMCWCWGLERELAQKEEWGN